MTSENAATERKTIDQQLAALPGDAEVEILTDPDEIAFLQLWRESDDAGRKRIDKVLNMVDGDRLPPLDAIKGMTRDQVCAFIDALPEA